MSNLNSGLSGFRGVGEGSLPNVNALGGQFSVPNSSKKVVATVDIATAPVVLTGAQLIGGSLNFTSGGAQSVTLPTATQIETALGDSYDGQSFQCVCSCTVGTTLTFVGNTGVTLKFVGVQPASNTTKILTLVRTAVGTWNAQ